MTLPGVGSPAAIIVGKLLNKLIPMEQENHPFGLPRTEVKIEDDALRDEKVCQEIEKLLTSIAMVMKLEFKDNSMSILLHSKPKNDTSSPQPEEFAFFLAQLTQGSGTHTLRCLSL